MNILEESKGSRKPLLWAKTRRQICRVLEGHEIEVYYNTHLKCLSIMRGGLVIGYVDEIKLVNAVFKIRPSAQARARAADEKTVHALVVGQAASWLRRKPRTSCRYNFRDVDGFVVRSTEAPVKAKQFVHIKGASIAVR